MTDNDTPRSLRDERIRRRRREMLGQPHVVALTKYAADLRQRGSGEVPDFDPLDGGTEASVLFLFEKPGPMTSEALGGSGFISRNNDDPTAEATFNFMQQAGVPRKATVIWNVVPWWNSTRTITAIQLSEGAACVSELVALLPRLRAVVCVGKKATVRAAPYLVSSRFKVLASDHPSPLVRARWRDRWNAIPDTWVEVRPLL